MDKEKFNKLIVNCKCKESGSISMKELFEFFFPKIVLHISAKYRNQNLGEDIAQEFFTKLLKLEIMEEINNPLAWVYKICDNLAKDYFEKDSRYKAAYISKNSIGLDEPFERIVFLEYLEQIDKFDLETRTIFFMYMYNRFTLKEIAEELKLNYNTVRQKLSRGIKKLKKI